MHADYTSLSSGRAIRIERSDHANWIFSSGDKRFNNRKVYPEFGRYLCVNTKKRVIYFQLLPE